MFLGKTIKVIPNNTVKYIGGYMNHNLDTIITQAKLEIEQEDFRVAVEKCKVNLRLKRSLWSRIFPWKIVIIRKGLSNV